MLGQADKRAIAGRFAAAADHYDAAADVQARIAQAMADRLAALDVGAVTRVLEIGCGTGLLTAAGLKRLSAAHWLATDIAPSMVAACRRRLGADPRLSLAVMDGEAPAVAPGFDLVCSTLALQWFPDAGAALSAWMGLLRPGGVLCVATLGNGTFTQWRQMLAHAGAGDPGPTYPDADVLSRWLGPAGRVERQDFVQSHTDARHFLGALRGIGADYGGRRLPIPVLRRAMRALDAAGPVQALYDVCWLTVRI